MAQSFEKRTAEAATSAHSPPRPSGAAREHVEQKAERVKAAGKTGKARAADEFDRLSQAADAAAEAWERDGGESLARYAHSLSDGMSDLAGRLRERSVEELAPDARRIARENPTAFLLGSVAVGVGLSRFFKASRRPGARERLGDAASSVRDRARSARYSLGEQASDFGHSIRDRAETAQRSLEHLLHDQPLVAGALGVVLGAAIGALLPSTDREDEWLGEASDRLKQGARETAASLGGSSKPAPRSGQRTAAETVSQGYSPEFPKVTRDL